MLYRREINFFNILGSRVGTSPQWCFSVLLIVLLGRTLRSALGPNWDFPEPVAGVHVLGLGGSMVIVIRESQIAILVASSELSVE